MFDINNLTENEVRQAFRCSNSECDCHKGKHVHCALSETHKNNDANPSMSIDKKDGKVVSHCFTGCNQSDLFNAVLKKCREEYGDDSNSSSNKKAYTIESIKRFKSNGKPYLRHHIYEVDGGCYLKAIFSDGKSKKQALFYHSTDGKQWFSKRHFEPVLYNRKAIKEDVQVIFPEGEKDVDTLIVYGYAAVTTGGADDKLTPKMIQDLSGKIIFCIADNDKPGREYMRKIAKAVNDFCNVFMVDLPGYWHKAFDEIIPEKADITDFVEKCKSAQFDDATIKQHISIMMQQDKV
jgi:5S rRNA maturation endonuclease (ribonuclease M5)